jgi:hypothetical protein
MNMKTKGRQNREVYVSEMERCGGKRALGTASAGRLGRGRKVARSESGHMTL